MAGVQVRWFSRHYAAQIVKSSRDTDGREKCLRDSHGLAPLHLC